MKQRIHLNIKLLILSFALTACTTEKSKPITIAINPWPGYEFLYLAEKKGFFKQAGANITLIQMGSLADTQRAYVNGHVDGMASTIIEAVQAQPLGGKPLKVILITDYSNGGDVIIAADSITGVKSLKGQKVGCEVSSLGIYILERALTKHGLTLDDVTIINTEQLDGEQAMLDGKIDAFVSYPPVSLEILKHKRFRKVFTSSEIPEEIIDTVSVSSEVLDKNPGLETALLEAWQMAIDYAANNKQDAYAIMAKREGISVSEFEGTLSDLSILDSKTQKQLLSNQKYINKSAQAVCETLVHVGTISTNCNELPDFSYRGSFQVKN